MENSDIPPSQQNDADESIEEYRSEVLSSEKFSDY